MTTKEITGFYLGTDGTARYTTIKDDLHAYYDLLGCDTIDMQCRKIGSLVYTIVCDDEALIKDNPVPTLFGTEGKPMLYGSLFFCLDDDKGDVQSLTHAHAINLAEHLFCGIGPEGPRFVMSGGAYRCRSSP